MMTKGFLVYLLVSAGVTYLIRMLPLVLVKRKIENTFVLSFLYYIPYAVLAVMTVPAMFSATGCTLSGIIGFAVAFVFAYMGRSLVTVAFVSCFSVFVCELAIKYL